MYAAAPTTDTRLPSLDDMDPREWIRAVWTRYLELWPKILGLQHRAAELAYVTESGWLHDAARDVLENARHLGRVHTATVRKVEEYSGYIGLNAVPGVVPASVAVGALALLVLWSFRRYDALERTLQAVESGTLTPGEATALLDAAGPMPDVGVLGGTGLGLLVGIVATLGALYWLQHRRRDNPDLVVLGLNPPWSSRVLQLDYVHAANGQPYTHSFGRDVHMEGLEDGSVRLWHPSKPIWKDF